MHYNKKLNFNQLKMHRKKSSLKFNTNILKKAVVYSLKDKRSLDANLRSSAPGRLAPLGNVLHLKEMYGKGLFGRRLQPHVVPPVHRVVDVHLIANCGAKDVFKLGVQEKTGAQQQEAAEQAAHGANTGDQAVTHFEIGFG